MQKGEGTLHFEDSQFLLRVAMTPIGTGACPSVMYKCLSEQQRCGHNGVSLLTGSMVLFTVG